MAEFESKLVLPKSLDEDIKRRVSSKGVAEAVSSTPLASDWDRTYLAERVKSRWTSAEISYYLYGSEHNGILVCTGFYPHEYNFLHYLNQDNPEEMAREDVCPDDRALAPHVHSFLTNDEKNPFSDKDFLGWMHNHPLTGFASRKTKKTVESVGLSESDWEWVYWYLEAYGSDNRKLAFPIYYSGENADFYKSIVISKSMGPAHLDVVVE